MEEIKPAAVGFDPQAAWGPPRLTDDEVQALLTVWRNDPDFERKVDAALFVHGTVFILEHKLSESGAPDGRKIKTMEDENGKASVGN